MRGGAKEKLVDLVVHKAFDPVLRKGADGLSEADRRKLEHVQRATKAEIERYRGYGSASEVVTNFRRDLNSEAARRVHRELEALHLPTINAIRDEFETEARDLGVKQARRRDRRAGSSQGAKEIEMSMTLTSPAFEEGTGIPEKYSRDGDNLMPPLKWTGAPEETRSFALIIEDPDAPNGMFRHLGAYNIPRDRDELGQSADTAPDAAAINFARNDFGNERYDGPEPPHGDEPHHYHFRLAALDVPSLDVPQDAGIAAIWKAAGPHIIAEADLTGTYQR